MHTMRKPAELKLVNGADTIIVRPRSATGLDPVMCKQWDLGSPEARYTTVANPGSDGSTMSDGFVGSRTVTLDLVIMGGKDPVTGQIHDAYWYAAKLTAMTHPAATPVLKISRDDELNAGRTWNMNLRGSPYSIAYGPKAAAMLELQLTFTCPLGLIEGPLLSVGTVDKASDDDAVTDLRFPATFPKTFGLVGATYPQLAIEVGGDTAVIPTVYISGPVTNPDVRSGTDRFRFDNFDIPAGQTVQIDMNAGAVRLGNTDGAIVDDMNVYNAVDWSVSTFWRWLPGPHTLRFYSTTGSVTVQYRERRLTI
jgi:hypothetical protein